jgi:hypothetical protein
VQELLGPKDGDAGLSGKSKTRKKKQKRLHVVQGEYFMFALLLKIYKRTFVCCYFSSKCENLYSCMLVYLIFN